MSETGTTEKPNTPVGVTSLRLITSMVSYTEYNRRAHHIMATTPNKKVPPIPYAPTDASDLYPAEDGKAHHK